MNAIADLHGALALARRRWFQADPGRRAGVVRPVISIGNLAVGGRGKTPVVAEMARLLVEMGERPAILTRGYARRDTRRDLVVVHDGVRLRADVAAAGDEPLMLARALGNVAVIVAADRALAAVVAEARLGCTVHLLDDGFQHHRLERDLDCVIVTEEDVTRGAMMPAGRLREPLEVLAEADVVFTDPAALPTVTETAVAMGIPAHHVLSIAREPGVPRMVEPWGAPPRVPRTAPVVAVAGIAGPERFFDSLRTAGWNLVDQVAFADHHWFTRDDVARIDALARRHAAALILTTEKDIMRLLPWRPLPLAVAWVPLELSWPVVQVREIVVARLAMVRRARSPEPPWPVTMANA
jgi:tetraacyldisaccharide 4'-kinase